LGNGRDVLGALSPDCAGGGLKYGAVCAGDYSRWNRASVIRK
jgi:hypothetical protein